MATVDKATRRELIRAISERYRDGGRQDKKRILDEFVALTGYHRKHAIRLLNEAGHRSIVERRRRPRIYDEAVEQALIILWEAADRICGKRLKPLLPSLIAALERHGHLQFDNIVREKLLTISAASIDRLLRPAKEKTRRPRRKPPAVRGKIPIRTFADWQDPGPGFMEIDLVAHCGGGVGGRYAHTLVLTDICSGWTECVALAVRDSALVVQALEHMVVAMPFPLRGIDSDNGSEFINEGLLAFCEARSIEFTRSRPYRKNDQAWVEQKNGAVVRRMVGYGRLSGLAASEALARLYASTRLFVNFFQPSFKLLSKERVGAKLRKRYQTPMTPCARLLESRELDAVAKERLQAVQVTIDPLRLLDEIRSMQGHLAGLANGEHVHVPPHRDADLDAFLRTLQHAWRKGEVRPTHQPKPNRERHWRTRSDPFEAVWPTVVLRLEEEPDRTAKDLFHQLCTEHPGEFRPGQLRTLQRRVKGWRTARAQKLIFVGASVGCDSVAESAVAK